MNLGWSSIGVFIAAGVLTFVNMNYDSISPFRDEADRMANHCEAIADRAGFSRSQGKKTCDCAVDNVREWRKENPDADYTPEVHEAMMVPCVPGASQARSQARAMERRPVRVSRPSVRRGKDEDSNGWGNGAGGSGSEWGD